MASSRRSEFTVRSSSLDTRTDCSIDAVWMWALSLIRSMAPAAMKPTISATRMRRLSCPDGRGAGRLKKVFSDMAGCD